MHADIHGAGSVVIKNPTQKPVPKLSLDEAAIFTVCRSKAWESKVNMHNGYISVYIK